MILINIFSADVSSNDINSDYLRIKLAYKGINAAVLNYNFTNNQLYNLGVVYNGLKQLKNFDFVIIDKPIVLFKYFNNDVCLGREFDLLVESILKEFYSINYLLVNSLYDDLSLAKSKYYNRLSLNQIMRELELNDIVYEKVSESIDGMNYICDECVNIASGNNNNN